MSNSSDTKKSSVIGQVVSTVVVLVVIVLAIEGYHRWKKHRLEQDDPLAAAQERLAELHRERIIAWSKLSQFNKNKPLVPKLEIQAGSLSDTFAAEIVAAEEQFAEGRDAVREHGGRWVLFGPTDDEIVVLTTEKRLRNERRSAVDRSESLSRLAAAYPKLQSRVDKLVEAYQREIEYWDEQLREL